MSKPNQTTTRKDYWTMPESEVYEALGTSEQGLSEREARYRLKNYGYNELPRQAFTRVQVFLRQLKNPIFVILSASAVVAGFFGNPGSAIAILIMIGISVVLGFYNEYRAERIIEDLRRSISIKAVVTRDGKSSEIDSRLLVPGDLVSIYVGDMVPADMRVVECKELHINEAALTGESFPVEKVQSGLSLHSPTPQELVNYLFMGTVVMNGRGHGIVISTGKNTEFGTISGSLARAHPETEFQRGIKSYGTMLLMLTAALTVGIFGLNAVLGHDIIQSLLFSLAVAVGLVPELMPAIVTISLSQGARRMSRERVVVKRLVSIEDFGNMDVLCTDKTGTLTEGRISLKDQWPVGGGKDARVLCYSLLCNTAIVNEQITGNPIDVAIWEYALKEGGAMECVKPYAKVDEVPFDYERRRISVVVRRGEELILITKGAPESVIPRCGYVEVNGSRRGIGSMLESVNAEVTNLSEEGYRMIAVAFRPVGTKASYTVDDEADLTLLGFLMFADPAKEDARQALLELEDIGVDIRILTGDNELVASKICEELDIPVKQIVLGADLAQMSWTELTRIAEDATIFARITPEQKLDIIRALKEKGHVVGFMGDGVNDAPALYEADVGVSVDSAVDVSKDAADIVLLQKDLLVLARGIKEGRKTFGNTIKYVLMGTSSNFGNMFSAAFATLFLPFLPMLPIQILFMNLLYDVANMTLPTDNVDEEYIKRPKRWDMNFVRKYTLFFGPFSSLYDFLTYGIMLFIFGASEQLFQSGWFVESFWTEVFVMFVIRTRRIPFLTSRPGKWLVLLTLSCIAFGTVLPFTVLGSFFGFTALPVDYWILLILMVITYLLLVDAGKVFFYKICGF